MASTDIPIFQVDAFSRHPFGGNPAAICPLEQWLDDSVMQAVAAENNLSETAFFVPEGEGFALRWFTPVAEVDLCGHATLAAAHVLFHELGYGGDTLTFTTRSGPLTVRRDDDAYAMDFPAESAPFCAPPPALVEGLGATPVAVLAGADYTTVFDDEAFIRNLTPDLRALRTLDRRGVAVTAPGDEADFVSRFFAPRFGIDEDPVTGSAHCLLAPYWAKRLNKTSLQARQLSGRGGDVRCTVKGDRVELGGEAVTVIAGRLMLILDGA